MKYQITRNNEVGKAEHGWLHAKHYFSFASYYNPDRMGFGKLRVINDDVVEPGQGFGTHPHKDMEIITIPLAGAVSHKDSAGHEGTIRKGEVQVMSAGTGILHSEFNNSPTEKLNLFQIWIEPNKKSVAPRYGQESFDFSKNLNAWTQVVSPIEEGDEPGLKIHQQAFINVSALEANQSLSYQLKTPGSGVYFLVAQGQVKIGDQQLASRDSIEICEMKEITLQSLSDSEVIAIEVPLK